MNKILLTGVAAVVLAASAACSKTEHSSATAIPQESRDIFSQRCSACHGTEGKGNGAAAAALTPKPRDYTDVSWQKATTDDQLRKVIVGGGASVGKSPLMPPNPDLESKPLVVDGLVAIIRSF